MPPPPKTEAPAPAAAAAKPVPTPPPVDAPAAPAAASAAGPKGIMALLPAILAVVVAPVGTWATAEFFILPRLEKKLALPPTAAIAAAEPEGDAKGKAKPTTYEFNNVVVNLAGTMGTRYLKTSFHVVGDAKGATDVKKVFEENHTKLYDTTLNVLSSLTLADLEEAGAKNVIREKLVSSYNQALGKRVAEQVYFSDFVVQ